MSNQEPLIEDVGVDKSILEDIYVPEGSTSDTDEEVSLSNTRASVVRCLQTASRDEDWQRTSVFYTYIVHEERTIR